MLIDQDRPGKTEQGGGVGEDADDWAHGRCSLPGTVRRWFSLLTRSSGFVDLILADISRITQALARGKAWTVLDKSIITQVSKKFAERFAVRFTKQSLGKVVPVTGVLVGSTLNWTTRESIVDAAGIAYRQRFLLEKYPQLADDGGTSEVTDAGKDVPDSADEAISVIDEIVEAGGPDLR